MSPAAEHRKLAAILFTDMMGYSALAQRDEALALEFGIAGGASAACAGHPAAHAPTGSAPA